jgi:RNA polymerase sigma-70 factor, ECF subfamily
VSDDRKMPADAAFDRWYALHFDRIRVLCARILRDPAAAEDMAQETLLRAWVRRDQMREEDLGAWLSVVARNLCLSAIRKDGRLVVTDELPESADHSADPAIEVGRRESRRNVRRALGKLGDRNRRVIDLREVREANYEEIGSELGVSAEGARAIAFRARRVLREHLAAVGEGFSGVLVGIRIRVRNSAVRARSWMGSELTLTPLLQAGLAIALTTGVVFGGAATPDVARASTRSKEAVAISPIKHAARAPEHVQGGSSSSPDSAGNKGKSLGPLNKKPDVVAKPWDDSQSSDITVKYGDFIIFSYRRHPTEDDGLEGARRMVDLVVNLACQSPAACELIQGE